MIVYRSRLPYLKHVFVFELFFFQIMLKIRFLLLQSCVEPSWQPYLLTISDSVHAIESFLCMNLPWLPSLSSHFFFIFFEFQLFHRGVDIIVNINQDTQQTVPFYFLLQLIGIEKISLHKGWALVSRRSFMASKKSCSASYWMPNKFFWMPNIDCIHEGH